MDIGQRIRQRRKELGFNADYIAKKMSVYPSTVYRWENGDINSMSTDKFKLLADILGMNPADLLGSSESASEYGITPVHKKQVPMLGSIAAGVPIYCDEQLDEYVTVNDDLDVDFALTCDGDSMEPTIRRGDVVFFRAQDDVDNGQIAAVIVDDSATLKRVYHGNGFVQLVSENPAYAPMVFTENVRVLGRAVYVRRKLV